MRIACPSCAVTYDVPDTRLKPGRKVRCARCNQEWEPPVPEEAAPDEPPTRIGRFEPPDDELPPGRPAASAMDLLAAHRKRQEQPRVLRAAWIASALLLAGLLVASVVWRNAVKTAWPPSERIYAAVGLGGSVETKPGKPAGDHTVAPAAPVASPNAVPPPAKSH